MNNLEQTIEQACEFEDLDEACRLVQDKLGVKDGGVAAVVFSNFDWTEESRTNRLIKMRAYVRTEYAYLV